MKRLFLACFLFSCTGFASQAPVPREVNTLTHKQPQHAPKLQGVAQTSTPPPAAHSSSAPSPLPNQLHDDMMKLQFGQQSIQKDIDYLKESTNQRLLDQSKSLDRIATLENVLIGLGVTIGLAMFGGALVLWKLQVTVETALKALYYRLDEKYPT
jgi:hypothetical protein